MFSPSEDSDTSEDVPPTPRATPADAQVYLDEEEEEEDFQMVPLDDKHWTTEEVPDRHIVHTRTCLTAWTMPISVSLCKLLTSLLCQQHGLK